MRYAKRAVLFQDCLQFPGRLLPRRAGAIVAEQSIARRLAFFCGQFLFEFGFSELHLFRTVAALPSVAQHFRGRDVFHFHRAAGAGSADFVILIEKGHRCHFHLIALGFHRHFHRSGHGDLILFDVQEQGPERAAASSRRGESRAIGGKFFAHHLAIRSGLGPTFGQGGFADIATGLSHGLLRHAASRQTQGHGTEKPISNHAAMKHRFSFVPFFLLPLPFRQFPIAAVADIV